MNKKKMIRVLSIGTILGGIVSAGIPITAEAVINAYTVKVNDEFYKYDKQELIDDFLNFKCGDKSTLYDDFARKLKEGNGFYAFQDTEKGFIDYGDIRDAFLKTKEENKSFDVEEFVKTKEAKVIEVSWVKKAIVTKDGEVKYETPLNKDDKEKQDSKENEKKEKQDDDKSKDVVNDESKTSEHKSSSHHKKKHSHKSSSDGVVKEKEQGKQEEGKQEKEVKEKEKQEQGKQDKELKEKEKQEEGKQEKEVKEKEKQEKEQAQKDKELKEKQEKEQAQKEKELKEKQEQEQAQKEKELKEKQEKEQAQKEKELKEKQEQEQAQKEKELKEKQEKEQAQKDKELKEKQEKEQAQKDKELKEKQEQEQTQKDKKLKEKQEQEQAQKDKELKEKQEKEQAQKDKELKEKQEKEQAQKDKELKEKQEQEQAQKDKKLKEKQEQEQAQKDKETKDNKQLVANNKQEFEKIVKQAILDCETTINVSLPNYSSNKSDYKLSNYNDLVTELGEMDFGKPSMSTNYQWSDSTCEATVTFEYRKDVTEVKKQKKEAIAEAKKIIKKVIKQGMTDFEKELALHDYVVKTADYDTENYKNKTTTLEDHNAYGVLVNHIGVCESYAKAMSLLLNEVGIECKYVTGTGNAGGHAWNMVKLDNEWYNLDATWDDPVSDRNGKESLNKTGSETVRHTYFNIPDSIFEKDHTRGKLEQSFPKCTATKYSYNNMDVDEYTSNGELIKKVTSKDELDASILEALQKGQKILSLRIKGFKMTQAELSEEVKVVANKNNLGGSWRTSYPDEYHVTYIFE